LRGQFATAPLNRGVKVSQASFIGFTHCRRHGKGSRRGANDYAIRRMRNTESPSAAGAGGWSGAEGPS